MKSAESFEEIKNSQNYTEWPEVSPALLKRVHGELRQNLSSLLNGSPYLAVEAYTPFEVRPRPETDRGAEDDDLEFADLAVFYMTIRPQVAVLPGGAGGVASDESAAPEKRTFGAKDYAKLLSLPAVFFRKHDFDVTSVLAGEDVLNPFLMAKFSFFLDTIELELVKLTSRNSDSFFSALSEISSLHALVQRATAMIRASRGALERSDQSIIRSGLVVPQLLRRSANAANALNLLERIGHVMANARRVDTLQADGRFADALELIVETSKKLGPLRGVASLRDMPSLLDSKLEHMKRDMEQRLTAVVAVPDFNRTEMERVCLPLLQGFARAKRLDALWPVLHKRHLVCIADALAAVVNLSRTRAGFAKKAGLATVVNLSRTRAGFAKNAGSSSDLSSRPPPPVYRPVSATIVSPRGHHVDVNPLYEVEDDALDEHALLSRSLGLDVSSSGGGGGGGGGATSSALTGSVNSDGTEVFFQSMRHEELITLLGSFVSACTQQVEKFVFLAELCSMVLETGTRPPSEMQEALDALCEFVHGQVAHILEYKSADNAKLSLGQFAQMYAICNNFVVSTENMTGRKSCHVLRGCLMTQAKGFLSVFHANQLRQLASCLESEKWSGVDVPGEYQVMVDRFCGQKESVQTKLGLWELPVVTVGSKKYRVVGAALQVVRSISDYAECLQKLPLLAVDMTLLIKAIHGVARLKSISTKNLALCYESVGLVLALIPPLRQHLCAVLSERQQVLLDDYGILAKEFEEHRNKLFAMLVSVMRQTVTGFMARMRSSEWGAFPDRVSEYVTGISEKTLTMHRLLLDIFSREELQRLMDEILAMYNKVLLEAFRGLDLPTKNARKRLKADVALLCGNLKSFDGISSSLGVELIENVNKLFAD